MTNINNNTLTQTNTQQSALRTKQDTGFGKMVSQGLSGAINTIQGAAGAVLPFAIPGGSVLSAAINSAGNVANAGLAGAGGGGGGGSALTTNLPSVGGGFGATGGSVLGGGVAGGGGSVAMNNLNGMAAKGDAGASMAVAQREMMEMNQSFNMQYLGLQQQMQNENRQFTTLSNLIKTRHDTAKAAINNIK